VPLGRLPVFRLPHRALLCESKRPSGNHNRFIRLNIFLDRL
jgi:hypothetical protein